MGRPETDLHLHLDGSLSIEVVKTLADRIGSFSYKHLTLPTKRKMSDSAVAEYRKKKKRHSNMKKKEETGRETKRT